MFILEGDATVRIINSEKEKESKLSALQSLLDENKHYYVNRHCFGEYYSEEEIEPYTCNQCGDWNGTWSDGTFKELFLGDLTSQLEYPLTITIEELWIKELFDIDDYDNYNLKDKTMIEATLDMIMNHQPLYSENVYFTLENEDYSIPLRDVPKVYIKEALIQLMTKVED